MPHFVRSHAWTEDAKREQRLIHAIGRRLVTHLGVHYGDVYKPEDLRVVPGWFFDVDVKLFNLVLEHQSRSGARGDLVELGAYQGKSAVVIGAHQVEGEQFTVLDLWGTPAEAEANRTEVAHDYPDLARVQFEANYRRFHSTLPAMVQGLSSEILDHVAPGSCRFVHVDASHLYAHVVGDIEAARTMLQPEGVVVLDDFRSPHTPGVAAATWWAVRDGLNPVALTDYKFYGTWGDPGPIREAVVSWVADQAELSADVQDIDGRVIVRVVAPTPARSLATRVAGRVKRMVS